MGTPSEVAGQVFDKVTRVARLAPVPGAELVFGLVSEITDAASRAKHNKRVCKDLAHSVHLSSQLFKDADKHLDEAAVRDYRAELEKIRDYITKLQEPGWFNVMWRKLNSDDIEREILDLERNLSRAQQTLILAGVLKMAAYVDDTRTVEKRKHAVQIAAIKAGANPSDDLWKGITIQSDELEIDEMDPTPVVRGSNNQVRKKIYKLDGVAEISYGGFNKQNEEYKLFQKQIIIMKLLRDCEHVLRFYGIVERDRRLFVITQWAEYGDLKGYLTSHPANDFAWPLKVKIAFQISQALFFCHDNDILHHDVRSKNILLDGNLAAKLSNFDLSRQESDCSRPFKDQMARMRWTAPEKLREPRESYTKKCDVYSFGILLWELSSHQLPFGDIERDIMISDRVPAGVRPREIPGTPTLFSKLMKECWEDNPRKRPRMKEACVRLRTMNSQLNRPMAHSIPSASDFSSIQPLDEGDLVDKMDGMYLDSDDMYSAESEEEEPLPDIRVARNKHREGNYAEAYEIYCKHASQNDDKVAHYYIGSYLYFGSHGIPEDKAKGMEHFKKSADKGLVEAQYLYGLNLCKSDDGDSDTGLKYLRDAANSGNTYAMYYLAVFESKCGVPQDRRQGKKLLENATKQGIPEAKELWAKFTKVRTSSTS